MDLKIEYLPITELKPYENNAKKHAEADVEAIKKSIEEFGFNDPIGIWHDTIVEGHGRILAAQELEMAEVPVIRLDHMTDEERRAYALAHNKTAELSEWDFEMLDTELEDIFDIDMSQFGFDISVDDESVEIVEDEVPEDAPSMVKLGDIWKLGKHRLICGDSTDVAVIDRLMDGVKADCVFTDPPYGMKKENEGVLNDNLNYDDLLDFNRQWIPLTFGALKDNGSWYCWGIDEPLMDIYSNILKPMQKNKQIAFRNLITWDKGNGQGQLSEDFRMYPIADEKCLFVMVGGDSVQGFSVNQEDYSENMDKVRLYLESEIAKLNQSDKTIANALGYKDGRTVNHWRSKSQFALPTRENYEALREYGKSVLKDYDFLKKDYTPKPIALCSRAIKSSSREGEIVLDVFGGSGSTLIACEQLNRKCCMCELDTHYCDVIIQRYINYKGTSDDVVLIRDGKEIPYRDIR